MATNNGKRWMMFSFRIKQLVKSRTTGEIGRITAISIHNPKCSANLWPLSYMYSVEWLDSPTTKHYAHELQFTRYNALLPAPYSFSVLMMLLNTNQLPALKL